MKALVLMSLLMMVLGTACDRSKGKGSDREWQQRQEHFEYQEQQQIDESNREVRAY